MAGQSVQDYKIKTRGHPVIPLSEPTTTITTHYTTPNVHSRMSSTKTETELEKVMRMQAERRQRREEEKAKQLKAAQAKDAADRKKQLRLEKQDRLKDASKDRSAKDGEDGGSRTAASSSAKRKRADSNVSQVSETEFDINSNKCTSCVSKGIECITNAGFACNACKKAHEACNQTRKEFKRPGRGRKGLRTAKSTSAAIPSAKADVAPSRSPSPVSDSNASDVIRDVCSRIAERTDEAISPVMSSEFADMVSDAFQKLEDAGSEAIRRFGIHQDYILDTLDDLSTTLAESRSDSTSSNVSASPSAQSSSAASPAQVSTFHSQNCT